jgi:hypothetical protein
MAHPGDVARRDGGHQMGSGMARRRGGLVLINTSMRPFSTATERLRPLNWAALLGMATTGKIARAANAPCIG